MSKTRYAQVGTGGRARMYYEAIATTYKDVDELVGFCDLSPTRMKYANSRISELGAEEVPMYLPHDFERMSKIELKELIRSIDEGLAQ